MPVFGIFLVRIFHYLDWIRRITEYLSVFSLTTGKYGPETLQIWTLFMQWFFWAKNWQVTVCFCADIHKQYPQYFSCFSVVVQLFLVVYLFSQVRFHQESMFVCLLVAYFIPPRKLFPTKLLHCRSFDRN